MYSKAEYVCSECKKYNANGKILSSQYGGDALDESFVLVSAVPANPTINPPSFQQQKRERIQIAQNLLHKALDDSVPVEEAVQNILSNTSLCTDCLNIFFELLDEHIATLSHENETYKKKTKFEISDQVIPPADEMHLREILKDEEGYKQLLEKENKTLKHSLEQLNHQEEQYWNLVFQFQNDVQRIINKKEMLEREYQHADNEIKRLSRLPVMKVFQVQYSDYFAIINAPGIFSGGIRLAKTQEIDWTETNAGLGVLALLGYQMQARHKSIHTNIKFLPMGSASFIEYEETISYELFFSENLKVNSQLNKALVLLIQYVSNVKEKLTSKDSSLEASLPRKIQGHTIDGKSILYNPADTNSWNLALSYILYSMCILADYRPKK